MEYINCDFCGCGDYEVVACQTDFIHHTTTEVFRIVRCKGCGLHYENPRPGEDEIGRYYSSEYSFHGGQPWWKMALISALTVTANSPLYWLINFIPVYGRKLVPYVKPKIMDPVLRNFKDGGRILDIGCGSGDSAHFWGASGALSSYRNFAEVHGLEVADDARKKLDEKGIPSYKTLTDVPRELQFDVIRMNWSLEHVHSPAEYFEFLANHLTVNGKAIVAVPNYDGIIYRLAQDCVELPIHLYHFRPDDIRNYAKRFDLEVDSLITFSYPQMFLYASEIFAPIGRCFPTSMSLAEARHFQDVLSKFDQAGLGNDMIAVLSKSQNS